MLVVRACKTWPPDSGAGSEVLAKAEDAALAASGLRHESLPGLGIGATSEESPPAISSLTPAPAPVTTPTMSLSEETRASKMFGGALAPALEEEDSMCDSSPDESHSDSDSADEMQGVISRNEKQSLNPVTAPSVNIITGKEKRPQLDLSDYLTEKSTVHLPDDEDEKAKTFGNNTISVGDMKDVLKKRSERRRQDRLSSKTTAM